MSLYKATYYTGQSSQGHEVTITLRDGTVFISYPGEGSWPVYVQWQFAGVKKLSASGSLSTYQWGSFPEQSIVTGDPELVALLDQNLSLFEKHYSHLLKGGLALRAGLVLFFFGLVALFYFILVPGTTAFLADQIPQQVEIDMGEQVYASVISEYQEGKRLSLLANEFARQLDFSTAYPIRISVVQERELNAFALPGGRIIVYDQLLHRLESPEAFAALLGHEVAHVKRRHSLKSLCRTLSNNLFISLLVGDLNGVTSLLVENADMLGSLHYSRGLEQAADQEALDVLVKNQLDQQGVVHLMETLQAAHTVTPIRLLSSHPLTQDRIAWARQHCQQSSGQENKDLVRLWEEIKKEKR